jgi:hypothetical protein
MGSKSMRQLHEEAMALEKKLSGLTEGARQREGTTDDASGAEMTGLPVPITAESGEPDPPSRS